MAAEHRASPRRHRRRRLRRAVRCEVPAPSRGRHHPDRPQQPPPVPAAALSGDDRDPVIGRGRPSTAQRTAQARQRHGPDRRGDRVRPRREDECRWIDPGSSVDVGYDYLIFGVGVGGSYFGHDEFAPWAPGMKTLDDALALRTKIFGAFEMAELAEDPAERQAWLTFAVVGGGPTGVEVAGQIKELAKRSLGR